MNIKQTVKRKLIQIAAFGFSNCHVSNIPAGKIYTGKWKQFCNPGINCYSCPAATLACPIGALQAVSGSGKMNFSFYVVGFLLAIGTVFGRFICGWLCPFGLIQELLNKIPTPKIKIWKGFTYIKYVILVVFVGILPVAVTNYMGVGKPAFCEFICPSGTLLGAIPLMSVNAGLRSAAGTLTLFKFILALFIVVMCVFVFRFFCKVICPLGAIYGLLNKISIYHLEVDEHKCVNCGKCAKVCKMDVNPVEKPKSAECIRCGECASNCPTSAICLGFKNRTGTEEKAQVTN